MVSSSRCSCTGSPSTSEASRPRIPRGRAGEANLMTTTNKSTMRDVVASAWGGNNLHHCSIIKRTKKDTSSEVSCSSNITVTQPGFGFRLVSNRLCELTPRRFVMVVLRGGRGLRHFGLCRVVRDESCHQTQCAAQHSVVQTSFSFRLSTHARTDYCPILTEMRNVCLDADHMEEVVRAGEREGGARAQH